MGHAAAIANAYSHTKTVASVNTNTNILYSKRPVDLPSTGLLLYRLGLFVSSVSFILFSAARQEQTAQRLQLLPTAEPGALPAGSSGPWPA